MSKLQRNKGSALLMVVGLMTIIVMLGMTYLAIAHMDAKNSTIQLSALQAGPMTDGSLVYFLQSATNDLCIDPATPNSGPYSKYPDGGTAPSTVRDWIRYTTSPSQWDAVKGAEVVNNTWLSPATQDFVINSGGSVGAPTYVWRSVGKFWKDGDPSISETSSTPGFVYNVAPGTDAVSDAKLADADGDGTNDSRLYYSGVTNAKGWKYYVAARAIDTSSQLCINTAGGVGGAVGVGDYCTVGSATTSSLPDGSGASWPASRWKGGGVLLTSAGAAGLPGFIAANPITGISDSVGSTLNTSPAWVTTWAPSGNKTAPDTNCTYQIMTDPHAITPMSINLSAFMGANFEALHTLRCGTALDRTFPVYNNSVATQLFSPKTPAAAGTSYLPFSMADEMYLRGATVPDYAGRLLSMSASLSMATAQINGNATAMRNFLTTYSCSRSLPRITSGTLKRRISLYPDATNNNDLNTPANQQALYTELAKFMPGPQAAHLVANLWAASYSNPATTTQTNAFAFTGGTTTAYGLVPQPFITEAVAAYLAPTTPLDLSTAKALYAVEMRNYTGSTIDLTQYKAGPDLVTGTSLIGSLAPGATVVVYYCVNGALTDFATVPIAGTPIPLTTAINMSLGGAGIVISRTVAGTTISVDSVKGSDIPANVDWSAAGVGVMAASTTLTACGARDDDPDRMRYMVPPANPGSHAILYAAEPAPTLGASNALLAANPAFNAVQGYKLFVGPMASIGNVGDLFVTGPEPSMDLPHNLVNPANLGPSGKTYDQDYSRGKVDFRAPVVSTNKNYPDVPFGCLLAELIECVPADTTRTGDDAVMGGTPVATRIYGRLNIANASADALSALPFPQKVYFNGAAIVIVPKDVAAFIVNYRDKTHQTGTTTTPDYTGRATATGIAGLRSWVGAGGADTSSDCPGFLTPGELAIPLADYMRCLIGTATTAQSGKPESDVSIAATVNLPGYIEARDALYKAVANCITVNSDTFAAYVLVQLYDPTSVGGSSLSQTRYVAVFDRSNCRSALSDATHTPDKPAILLTSPLP